MGRALITSLRTKLAIAEWQLAGMSDGAGDSLVRRWYLCFVQGAKAGWAS